MFNSRGKIKRPVITWRNHKFTYDAHIIQITCHMLAEHAISYFFSAENVTELKGKNVREEKYRKRFRARLNQTSTKIEKKEFYCVKTTAHYLTSKLIFLTDLHHTNQG